MKRIILTLILSAWCGAVFAAPAISGVSGTVSHGQSITISGSGFGANDLSKKLWDNCSGTNIKDIWTNYMIGSTGYGGSGGDANYDLAYRTPAALGRGVALPHSHITKYLCGAHYLCFVSDGSCVQVWKTNTATLTDPTYVYMSWYRRLDPSFSWSNQCQITDYNFKDIAWGLASDATPSASGRYISRYDGGSNPPNYLGYWAAGPTESTVPQIELQPHENTAAKWVKTEAEFKFSTSGYVKVWEDGVLKMHEAGNNWFSGGPGLIAFEDFARPANSNAWRYMCDMYLDWSAQRVLIGNANTLAGCTTLRAVQNPTSWSDTSITVTVNQDNFADSSTAYLYVFDATGASNSTGYSVTFGSGGGSTPAISGATLSNASVH